MEKFITILMIACVVSLIVGLGAGLYQGLTHPSYEDVCRASGGVPIYSGGGVNCADGGFIDIRN